MAEKQVTHSMNGATTLTAIFYTVLIQSLVSGELLIFRITTQPVAVLSTGNSVYQSGFGELGVT